MKKTYIIILVVAIVGAVGLYIYQNRKKEKELSSHHNRQYNRIIEAARKSSIAGLVHMGRALNNYKEQNGAYPDRLSVLYPDFVPVKEFIDDIQWHYKPSGKDFILSKTIRTKGDKVVTASIGPNLMPRDEADMAVASIATPKQISAGTESKPSKKSSKTGASQAPATKSKPMAKSLTPNISSTGLTNSRGKSGDSTKTVISKKRPLPESEKVSTHKLTEKEKFVHGIKNRQEILVWKNDDGSLGFSNIQYPRSKELTVYDRGEWVQIRRHRNWYALAPKDDR
ncbi:MAG: hypothetical protein KJP23_09095 [Deltaproteobacteria bacterium]|nr:hypothetical protein [Deltaproteobacteria bacterium]